MVMLGRFGSSIITRKRLMARQVQRARRTKRQAEAAAKGMNKGQKSLAAKSPVGAVAATDSNANGCG